MKFRISIIGLALVIIVMLAFSRCNDGEMDHMKESAMVSFKLVDDPVKYDAILIDLVGLEYKLEVEEDDMDDEDEEDDMDDDNESDDDEESDDESARKSGKPDKPGKSGKHDEHDDCDDEGQWFTLDIEPQVINILELQNGAEALLAESEIPAGELKEIRLILGENNKIVVEGDTMDLKVPSGSSSGLKIKVHSDIEAGELYDVVIDFVASKSIVKKGNGEYMLKPVVKVKIVEDDDPYGSISGMISPADLDVLVHAIDADDDTTSTQPEDGAYFIDLLWPGTYTVVVETDDESGFEDVTLNGIIVIEEETTEIETVTFE